MYVYKQDLKYMCVCTIAEKNGSDSYSVVPLFQWQLDLLAGKVTSNDNNQLLYSHSYIQ